jgi:prevent-host-death family protein
MKTVTISEFKARCIAIINEVSQTHSTVIITRRGIPVSRLEPVNDSTLERVLGKMGKMTIQGDIIHTDFSDEWEMNK